MISGYLAYWIASAVLFLALSVSAHAQQLSPLKLENITYMSSQTIRDFVDQHLGDPDLWPYILELNQIASPAELHDGLTLGLPVAQVRAADTALLEALTSIQTATAEGAQVFAPEQISGAIENHEDALVSRDTHAWSQVVKQSNVATLLALEALEIALKQRDRSAEAVVSDVQGSVQGRSPAEPSWSGRGRNDILVEYERVRTLSASTTQITFRDLSRLRLNANSNATIQRMRSDPLTGDEVTKVSLVNGDFYALLNQLSEKNAFEIDVPGVQTKTESGDFWVKNDPSGARFVNYDQAQLEVTRGGTSVMLGENEGVVLDSTGAQTAQVLDSPQLTVPAADATLYGAQATFEWTGPEKAAGYWLEVARDAGFNAMQISEWGITQALYAAQDLPPGRYFWRVAALDQLGLPGPWTKPGGFTLRLDNTPPFLTLFAPGDGELTQSAQIDLFGASEDDAEIRLNGQLLDLATDGSFQMQLTLTPGENLLNLQAIDPPGNITDLSQTVIYRPKEAVDIRFDPAHPRSNGALSTRSDVLSVRASTTAAPDAPVVVRNRAGDVVVQTLTDATGGFSVSVPVTDRVTPYSVEILGPTGTIEGRAVLEALRDEVPPAVMLDQPLPRATDVPDVVLSGDAGDAIALTLNGAAVPLANGRFTISLTLARDVNSFDLVASDAVGNLTASRLQTVYDIDPPVISSASVTRPEGADGPITIKVAVTDSSGLRRSATYLLSIAGLETDGFLRCDTALGLCSATLPPAAGALHLIEVAVDDYAGNTAFK